MADMHTPLLPCPFCDGDAVEFTERDDRVEPLVPGHSCDVFVSNSYFGVRCERCDVGQTNPFIERSDAIAAWNRRSPSQEAETVKALREQIATKDAALAPFAKCSEVYPDALPETAAAFGSIYDPRCPLTVGDFHTARAALAGSAS